MNYKTIEHLKDVDFKRLTCVRRETFDQMLVVIEKGLRDFGRPLKLSRADQLLDLPPMFVPIIKLIQ